MKYSYGDVTVYDATGNVKKVIKAKTINKKKWKQINLKEQINHTPGSKDKLKNGKTI